MKRILLVITVIILVCQSITAQNDSLTIMFYNVENFFDCKDDSLKDDSEFLPESPRAWHYGRFKDKAANISRVIINSGKGDIPAIVGLCEVENSYVMDYLTRYSPLKQLGYRYVITESPDERGIDVAMMYQREQFRIVSTNFKRFDTVTAGHRPTRDMLHCCGSLYTGDTIDIMIVHLPSRRNGNAKAEKSRIMIMNEIRHYADSIKNKRKNTSIIIMGDFNTNLEDNNLKSIFNNDSYSLLSMDYEKRTDIGSYKYQGIWQTLDHIITDKDTFEGRIKTKCGKMEIVSDDYLLLEDRKFMGQKPFRTYNGFRYEGGFSDHLPIKSTIYY